MKIDWNFQIPQNMRNVLANISNKQQLFDLFAQELLIGGILVKQVTGDADMLMGKEAMAKTEEFDSAVVDWRNTDVFFALLNHLNGEIHKNVIMETTEGVH